MSSFYGNFNKNSAMGGSDAKKAESPPPPPREEEEDAGLGFLDGFAKDSGDEKEPENDKETKPVAASEGASKRAVESKPALKEEEVEDVDARRKRMRLLRDRKVEEARVRYFERNPSMAPAAAVFPFLTLRATYVDSWPTVGEQRASETERPSLCFVSVTTWAFQRFHALWIPARLMSLEPPMAFR